MSPCRHTGCPKLLPVSGYCDQHGKAVNEVRTIPPNPGMEMKLIGTCKNCKWWEAEDENCQKQTALSHTDYITSAEGTLGAIITGPDFGCIHWAKQTTISRETDSESTSQDNLKPPHTIKDL